MPQSYFNRLRLSRFFQSVSLRSSIPPCKQSNGLSLFSHLAYGIGEGASETTLRLRAETEITDTSLQQPGVRRVLSAIQMVSPFFSLAGLPPLRLVLVVVPHSAGVTIADLVSLDRHHDG